MPGGSRSLPGRPNLRYLKLEAKRRRAAGEFASLHEAQTIIAREHGEPSWAALKQLVCAGQESHALDQLRWLLHGDVAMHAGGGHDGTACLTLRDNRTHVVLTSRLIPVNTIAERLNHSWT